MTFLKRIILKNTNNLYSCLFPEIDGLSNKRVTFLMELTGDEIIIEIHAKDETALKAIKNSLNKLIEIHTKTKSLITSL